MHMTFNSVGVVSVRKKKKKKKKKKYESNKTSNDKSRSSTSCDSQGLVLRSAVIKKTVKNAQLITLWHFRH